MNKLSNIYTMKFYAVEIRKDEFSYNYHLLALHNILSNMFIRGCELVCMCVYLNDKDGRINYNI